MAEFKFKLIYKKRIELFSTKFMVIFYFRNDYFSKTSINTKII